jgi:hypothetical protein
MTKASEAILDVLRDISATPEQPVEMYAIGIPLILGKKFIEDEVYHGLMNLKSEGVIELMDGNRLKLVKPLPDKA